MDRKGYPVIVSPSSIVRIIDIWSFKITGSKFLQDQDRSFDNYTDRRIKLDRRKKYELSEFCKTIFYINFYGKYTNVKKNINFKSD